MNARATVEYYPNGKQSSKVILFDGVRSDLQKYVESLEVLKGIHEPFEFKINTESISVYVVRAIRNYGGTSTLKEITYQLVPDTIYVDEIINE